MFVATVATNQLKRENSWIKTVIPIVNMIHKCSYCNYESSHKWVLRRHENTKHGSTPTNYASHPHPYVNPYLNNTTHPNEMRAPTTVSVGPSGPRAPTIVSLNPQRMGDGCKQYVLC